MAKSQYEYKVVQINWTLPELEDHIEALAVDGWRLVTVNSYYNYYIFERDRAEGSV